MILIAAVVTACLVAGYTFFKIDPTSSSTSTMLVLTKETTLTSLTDLQIGSTLTKDYSVLITSRPVLESVIENLGLKMGHKALKGRISVDNPEDTRLLFITVTMNDAKQAKAVVDELSIVASEFIGDKMEVTPPKIIEQGEIGSKNGPSITKNAMVGFLAGAFLVCVIIVVLELLNDTIQKEDDIERYLGIPTLAVIPEKTNVQKKGKSVDGTKKINLKGKAKQDMAYKNITLTDSNPGNYFYEEAMKTLRTNVQFSGKNNKVILLTSGHGNEGKSDISFNLAVELGKAGKKVLLIDADIRKSVYKERYNIQEETKGLSQYLSGQVEQIDEVVCKTNYENVYMILAGPYAPNPTEMLGDELFGQLLKAAKQVFQYVIIDTPPLGIVVDAAVIGQYCDGAIIVVEKDATSYRLCQKVKAQLEKSGCKILGAVLNKAATKGVSYYGKKYAGKYGKYGTYGSSYLKSSEK